MNKQRLITTSLISSIKWYQNSPKSWKDKAYNDLSNQLNRVWGKMNEAAQRGIDFENKVYEIAKKGFSRQGSEYFQNVVQKCIGGTFQDKLKANEVIEGYSYCLYGKSDVMFDKIIIDIKTTAEYKPKKYLDSFQHKLYMYITGREFFEYVVAEWDEYPKIKEVHCLDINISNPKITLQEEIHTTVLNAVKFLQERPILWKAYEEKFCR